MDIPGEGEAETVTEADGKGGILLHFGTFSNMHVARGIMI